MVDIIAGRKATGNLDLILADLEELTKAFIEVRLAAGRST